MRVLALAAHADDETLGCGGTLLRHAASGDELHWLIATGAWEPRWSSEAVARKAAQIARVAEAYGMRETHELGFPAGTLEALPFRELMERIEGVLAAVRPEVVYLVDEGDVHTDHGVVFRAAMSVLKPFRMASLGVRRVLAYETLSSTEAAARPTFVPNVYADVTGFLERKLELMAFYETELQPEPAPRSASSLRALARHRGATIAVEHAEAFALVRELA